MINLFSIIFNSRVAPSPHKYVTIKLESSFFNINEWIDYAQQKGSRALERVLLDLSDKIGGTSESKKKAIKGLNELMQLKYSNTPDKSGKYTNEANSPTNLDINRQNIVAAANFKNKLDKEVPSNHTTPQDSEVEDNDAE